MGNSRTYDRHDASTSPLLEDSPRRSSVDGSPACPSALTADGVVVDVNDGMFDRNQSGGGEPTVLNLDGGDGKGNFVCIDHGNGWVTWYCHMRKNSVSVDVGDVVKAGTILGLVGSSGNSSDPHLHFAVDYQGDTVETYLAPSAYWVSPLPYAPTKDGTPTAHYQTVHTENAGLAKIDLARAAPVRDRQLVDAGDHRIAGSVTASSVLPSPRWKFTKFIFVPITTTTHEFMETFPPQSHERRWRLVDSESASSITTPS